MTDLPYDVQRAVHEGLGHLPSKFGLLSFRRLVPVMQALAGRPNLLTAEAVAAAVVLEAPILVTTDSPLLNRVASAAGVIAEKV